MPPKKSDLETIELDGERVTFKKGALRKMLKVPDDYEFKKPVLRKLQKIEVGDKFDFLGKTRTMTALMKKRINFALILMKGK
jgi:hypothetical protein